MKRFLPLLTATLLLGACSTAPVQQATSGPVQAFSTQKDAMQVVSFQWQDKQQLQEALGAGLDVFGAQPRNRRAKARVTAEEFQFLKQLGTQPQGVIEPQMDTRGGLPSGYMTYAQMTQKLQALAKQYPHLVTIEDVGDTYLKKTGRAANNDIWAISITNKRNIARKPALMLTAGVHARELAPVELVMKLAEELASGYGKNPEITELLDTREAVFLPMVNVDGRIMVEQGDAWQRKNANGSGVDINRNFDAHWNYGDLDVPSSWKRGLRNPRSQTYSGTGPASEPETQAVQNMYHRKNITMAMDIHAYGEMFFWPLGYSEKPIPEVPVYKNIWQNTFGRLGYTGGTSLELLYATSGTTDDYGYEKHGAFSMGLEVGHSFRPSYPEVENIYRKTRSSFLGLLRYAGTVKK